MTSSEPSTRVSAKDSEADEPSAVSFSWMGAAIVGDRWCEMGAPGEAGLAGVGFIRWPTCIGGVRSEY